LIILLIIKRLSLAARCAAARTRRGKSAERHGQKLSQKLICRYRTGIGFGP
jgi:hypothetical protein